MISACACSAASSAARCCSRSLRARAVQARERARRVRAQRRAAEMAAQAEAEIIEFAARQADVLFDQYAEEEDSATTAPRAVGD